MNLQSLIYEKYEAVKFKAIFFLDNETKEQFAKIKEKETYPTINHPLNAVEVPVEMINCRLSSRVKAAYKKRYHFDFHRYQFLGKKVRVVGMILDGNWDIPVNLYSNNINYTAFAERFVEGKEWQETAYYNYFYSNERTKNKRLSKFNTFKEFEDHYLHKWEKLYHEMKESGYISRTEAIGKPEKEIEVCVSRTGKLLFRDGKHRLFIAKLLGLKSVPVIINVWHKHFIDRLKQDYDLRAINPEEAIKYIL